jgi:hypothetical protein
MFVEPTQMQSDCLRQGDVLKGIPFPALVLENFPVLGKIEPDNPNQPYPTVMTTLSSSWPGAAEDLFTAHTRMRLSFAVVLSHCCEIEVRPKKQYPLAPAFTLARIIPIKESIRDNPDKLGSLRENGDPRVIGAQRHVDYFHVASHERLGNEEWMVDFCQLCSWPRAEFQSILSRKILQMDDRTRVKFKIKYAYYASRILPEEGGAGLENPWA